MIWEELGGRTISNWVKNRVGKYVFPTLQKLPWEDVQWRLSQIIKQLVIQFGIKWNVEDIVSSIIDQLKGTMNFEQTRLKSPGEFRVYDSQGRTTGLVNGEVKSEIPKSVYDNGTVTIFFPTDSYRYEVAGTDEETYELEITSVENGESTTFTATDIPTTSGATHQYTIDWDALSRGEEGVTVQIDADGDGKFERSGTADNELTSDEFNKITHPPLKLISGIILVVALIALVLVVVKR